MFKRALILLVMSTVLVACNNDSSGSDAANASNEPPKAESSSEPVNNADQSESSLEDLDSIAVDEATDKIQNGDSFFVFLPGDSAEENETLQVNLIDAYDLIGDRITEVYAEGEGEAYQLVMDDNSDQLNEFLDQYDLGESPSFAYFEGDLYASTMENFNLDATKEDIANFISFPYDDEDTTAAPDISIDEDENVSEG